MGDDDSSKKKITIIGVSSLILVAMVVAAAVSMKKGAENTTDLSTSSKAATALCSSADHKESCEETIKSADTTDPKKLVKFGFESALKSVKEALESSSTLDELKKDPKTNEALDNCKDLMESSIDDIEHSIDKMDEADSESEDLIHELRIMLSGALTFEQTCLDQFENITGNDAGEKMKGILKSAMELTNNGLAIVTQAAKLLTSLNSKRRRLLSVDNYPSWVSYERRRLLQESPTKMKPNAVVAQDGSGQFKTLAEALKSVPPKNTAPYVIHMKAGTYKEYVTLDKKTANVVLIGDGPTKTRITNSRSFKDGITTMLTSTVSVQGPNFIAKDIGFENTAGPDGHQAVALRVQAHRAVFFNCHMDGYQDTLYVHAHSQFFRDCKISGTIDFIFGNAAAIFQNCQMVVRKPNSNQNCMVTAQGRITRNDPTGIVFQNCHVMGEKDYIPVKDTSKSFLGRPWKEYSVTIIMQSQIDDIISPEGWCEWNGNFGLNTLFYAEFGNRGPGAVETNRVKWKGIKKISPQEAESYTVGRFLLEPWIKASGVPYAAGMMKV